jgi:hypothetical protein
MKGGHQSNPIEYTNVHSIPVHSKLNYEINYSRTNFRKCIVEVKSLNILWITEPVQSVI